MAQTSQAQSGSGPATTQSGVPLLGDATWLKRIGAARPRSAAVLSATTTRIYALIGDKVAAPALRKVCGLDDNSLGAVLAELIGHGMIVAEGVKAADPMDLDFTSPEVLEKLRGEAEQVKQAEEEARRRVDSERKAKAQAEARVKAEAEAKARADADAKANAAALARLKAEKVVRTQSDTEINARQGALTRAETEARSRADTLAIAEADAKARAEAVRQAEAEAATRLAAVRRMETELKRKMAALARLDAERKQKADQEAQARDAAAALARTEALALAETERKAREHAEAAAATERKVREAAEAKVEAERQAREQAADQARNEAVALAESERKAREQAEARIEAERRDRAQSEAAAEAAAKVERQARKAAEEKAQAEARALAQSERRAREEAEAKAAAERRAREQAEALAAHERRAREDAARAEQAAREQAATEARAQAIAVAETERRAREQAEAKAEAKAEAERLAREQAQARAAEAQRARDQVAEQARTEALALAESERRAREAAELRAEAERTLREQAEARAEQRTREDAEARARDAEASEQRLRAEAESRSRSEQAAREAAEAKSLQAVQAERSAREQAEARAQTERLAREAAEQRALEQAVVERQARERAEALAAAERTAREEVERRAQAQGDAERQAREQSQKLVEAERLLREDAEARMRALSVSERSARESTQAGQRAQAHTPATTGQAGGQAAAPAQHEAEALVNRAHAVLQSAMPDPQGARPVESLPAAALPRWGAPDVGVPAQAGTALVRPALFAQSPEPQPAGSTTGSKQVDSDLWDQQASSAEPSAASFEAQFNLQPTPAVVNTGADTSMRRDAPAMTEASAMVDADLLAEAARQADEDAEAQTRLAQQRLTRELEEQMARASAEQRLEGRPADANPLEGLSGRRSTEEEIKVIQEVEARERAEAFARDQMSDILKMEEKRAREEEQRRMIAEEEAKRRAREAGEIAGRARAEREKFERERERQRKLAEAEAQALARAKARAAEAPASRAKPVLIGTVALLALIVGLFEIVPFNFYLTRVEQSLADALGERVVVRSMQASLVPRPVIRLSEVTVGSSDAGATIAKVTAIPTLGSLFWGPLTLKDVELETVTIARDFIPKLPEVIARQREGSLGFQHILVRNLRLAIPNLDLPPAEVEVHWDRTGSFERASILAYSRRVAIDLRATEADLKFTLTALNWQPLAGSKATIDSLKMNGTATRNGFEATEVDADLYAGKAQGSFTVRWGEDTPRPTATGEFLLRRLDVAKLLPMITTDATASGLMDGTMKFSLQAPTVLGLLGAPQVSTSFTVRRGWLGGIDLVRLLRDSASRGGRTVFDEWTGIFQVNGATHSLRQMRLVSGPLTATGSADIRADGRLTGRVNAQLSTGNGTAVRSNFGLGGTLENIEVGN